MSFILKTTRDGLISDKFWTLLGTKDYPLEVCENVFQILAAI